MMRFVEMNSSHVPQVAALEKQCFADPWSEKSVASELNNIWSYWVVALWDDTVIGYIGSQSTCDGETDVMNVADISAMEICNSIHH
jgi:ribosomal-protein-alanine N-acetyltransferase